MSKLFKGFFCTIMAGFIYLTFGSSYMFAQGQEDGPLPLPDFLRKEGIIKPPSAFTDIPPLLSKPKTSIVEQEQKYVPGELLLRLKPGVVKYSPADEKNKEEILIESGSLKELNEQFSLIALEKAGPKGVDIPIFRDSYKLIFPKDADIPTIASRYSQNPDVVYAEPNYVVSVRLSAEEKAP